MKTRLYAIIKPTEAPLLVATFERAADAEQCAWLLCTANVWDYRTETGKRATNYRSMRVNVCPGCGANYTHAEVCHRQPWGTFRCDCGVQFMIDWDFPVTPRELTITDRETLEATPADRGEPTEDDYPVELERDGHTVKAGTSY